LSFFARRVSPSFAVTISLCCHCVRCLLAVGDVLPAVAKRDCGSIPAFLRTCVCLATARGSRATTLPFCITLFSPFAATYLWFARGMLLAPSLYFWLEQNAGRAAVRCLFFARHGGVARRLYRTAETPVLYGILPYFRTITAVQGDDAISRSPSYLRLWTSRSLAALVRPSALSACLLFPAASPRA